MTASIRLALAGSAVLLAGATSPSVLGQISAGLWEVSGINGAPATRICVAKPPLLAQVEHRTAKCTRTVLRDTPSAAVIDYVCEGGGFGQSKITMLTPRSVKVETQGIADHAPFAYAVNAKRVGDCPAH